MSNDRAEIYFGLPQAKTWEDACAHMALFYEWVCVRGLHREELLTDLAGQPVDRFLHGFVEREVLPSLKLFLDYGVSELALFEDEYESYVEVFGPDRRAQSVARDGERGREAVRSWWDAALAASRRRRGERCEGASVSLSAGLESLGTKNVPSGLETLVRDLPAWARAALMGEPALEWVRFTPFGDGRFVRPYRSIAFPPTPSSPFELREGRAIAGDRDITDELAIEDRMELFGPAVAVAALVDTMSAHDRSLSALAPALEACVLTRIVEQNEGAVPTGAIVTTQEFESDAEAVFEAGRLPPMASFTWVPPRFAAHYRLPWARRSKSA